MDELPRGPTPDDIRSGKCPVPDGFTRDQYLRYWEWRLGETLQRWGDAYEALNPDRWE